MCACNALCALCWTQIKQVFHCVRRDLDLILVKGDNLYKSLHTSDMLSVDQLPAFVKMCNHDISVHCLRLETQLAGLINGDSFLRDLFTTGGNNGITLFLLFREGFTTAIIFLRNCYYIFDSHSREEKGLSVVDGTTVLMKFRDLYELEKYLQVAYLEYRDRQQFVEVNVGSNEKVEIYSQYVRTVRLAHDREYSADINSKQNEYYTSLKGSPQHSKMNMMKRQRSKRTYAQMKGASFIKRTRTRTPAFRKNGPYTKLHCMS